MTAGQLFAPFGLQRDMLLHATRASDGSPVMHRYGNVWEAFQIDGKVNVPLLLDAAHAAAEDLDSLQARLVHIGGDDRLVRDRIRPSLASSAVALAAGDVPSVVDPAAVATKGGVELLRHVVATTRDLQLDPPVHVAVLRLRADQHVLVVALDHAVSDGGTLLQFVRQMGRHYRARAAHVERQPRALPSFWAYLETLAGDDCTRRRAETYYRAALQRAGRNSARARFPDGRWQPVGRRDLTATTSVELDAVTADAIEQLTGRWRIPRQHIVLAALSWVVEALNGAFVPVDFLRNGRPRAAASVPGPFAEHVVTAETPAVAGSTVDDELGRRAASSAAAPPYAGTTQREFENPGSEENLAVVYNFLPGISPVRLGPAVMRADEGWNRALAPRDTTSRFAVRVTCLQDPGRPLRLTVDSDPVLLPEPDALAAAVTATLRAAAGAGVPTEQARARVAAQWA